MNLPLYPNRQLGIIGLHEESHRLYDKPHAFWALVNRETRRVIAGPFETQGKASAASKEAQQRGFDVVITHFPAKVSRAA